VAGIGPLRHSKIPWSEAGETMLNRKSSSGRIEVYIGKELKEAVIKSGMNVSEFLRAKLKEHFKESGIKVNIPEPALVLLVKCPGCGSTIQTSSLRFVRCNNCGKPFRPYPKKNPSSRIVKIIKGTCQDLYQEYYKLYGRRYI
jgi:formylmethanofuran dehydrogenase subunit E